MVMFSLLSRSAIVLATFSVLRQPLVDKFNFVAAVFKKAPSALADATSINLAGKTKLPRNRNTPAPYHAGINTVISKLNRLEGFSTR